jgi:hypothetical protein
MNFVILRQALYGGTHVLALLWIISGKETDHQRNTINVRSSLETTN